MGASLSNWQQTADLLFCHGTQQDLSPKYDYRRVDITGVVAFSLHAFTADCSSVIREGEERTIECRIENCSVPVSQDNVVWCLNYIYCGSRVLCDSRSLCINSTGITNLVGEAPAAVARDNIEVTNSGGLHIARVPLEFGNTTYNCSVVDREGIVCGPQSYTFRFSGPGKSFFFSVFACGLGKYFYIFRQYLAIHCPILCPVLFVCFVCLFCFCAYFFSFTP